MMCFILCEYLPQPLESCEWDGDDVCSYVVKYVCVMSLDLDSGVDICGCLYGLYFLMYKVNCGASIGCLINL